MKIGDGVIVLSWDSDEPVFGVLTKHDENWRNVTIRLANGELKEVAVREIKEASLFK